MNADGSDVERLTHSDAWELSLTWSPDARRIAFTSASFSDGDWGIYVMNADGSGVERLTSPLTEAAHPAWSPDGQRIAFSSNPDGHMEIYAMNADGSGVERLTSCSDAVSSSPAWSPDGQRIAFARTVRDRRTALWRPGEWDIYVMDADGSDAERLTYFGFKSTFPAWSPDGRRIAFESDIGINSEIYMMNADGSDIVGLTDSAGSASPAWSPDGRRIAFLSDVDGNGNTDIHVIALPSP